MFADGNDDADVSSINNYPTLIDNNHQKFSVIRYISLNLRSKISVSYVIINRLLTVS